MKDEQQLPASENGECGVVFVVEDDLDISRLIQHNLSSAGFAVQVFSNGNEVVSEALREKPSLFLLDIMLPGLPDSRSVAKFDMLTLWQKSRSFF